MHLRSSKRQIARVHDHSKCNRNQPWQVHNNNRDEKFDLYHRSIMLNISILFHIQIHILLSAILPSPQKARTKKKCRVRRTKEKGDQTKSFSNEKKKKKKGDRCETQKITGN